MRDLFFLPDRWEPDPMISTNQTRHIKVHGYSGKTVPAWQLGDWKGNWSAVCSSIPMASGWLEAGGEYRFCFCLNGGENSRGDEVCMLEIFGDDREERLCFPLNRGKTKPLLEKNHWLIYAIPFTAPAASDALYFRFVASGAVCTVTGLPEMNMAACDSIVPDEPDTTHAQRHNICFPNGWPEKKEKVVLKARGKEFALPKKTLQITAAAAGLTVGSLLVYQMLKRRK